MMLIGIDGNEANVGERVGVNVWAFEVLNGLYKKVQEGTLLRQAAEGQARRYKKVKIIVYLGRLPREDLPGETENWKYRVIGPGGLWTRWRLPLDLYFHRPRPDVFLSLSHYAPKWAPMPRVVSIMDLSFLTFPEAFRPAVLWQLTNWTKESVKNAAHVITISEFNKREIEKEYHCPAEKITVVYPGVSEMFKGRTLGTQGPTLRDKKYLLFVGTLQPKKNLRRLVKAFGVVRQRFSEVELVVAGKTWEQFAAEEDEGRRSSDLIESEDSSESERPESLRLEETKDEGITYLGYVPEKELPALYAGAEALVLPSLYEGFGIPAVEAMAVGVPVAASNVTSLPEIIAGGILFDPYNTTDMADKICELLTMPELKRRQLVKKGMIRAEMFNWDSAANKIMNVLQSFK